MQIEDATQEEQKNQDEQGSERKNYDTGPVSFKFGDEELPKRKSGLVARQKKYPEIYDKMAAIEVGEHMNIQVKDPDNLKKLAGACRNYANIIRGDDPSIKFSIYVREELASLWVVRKEVDPEEEE